MTLQHSLILYIHNIILTDQLSRRLSLASTLKTELTVLSQHDYLRNTLYSFTPAQYSFCIFSRLRNRHNMASSVARGLIHSSKEVYRWRAGLSIWARLLTVALRFEGSFCICCMLLSQQSPCPMANQHWLSATLVFGWLQIVSSMRVTLQRF